MEDAKDFRSADREGDQQIVEVECSEYSVKDMDLVTPSYFGQIFSMGRKYWNGEPGSDTPSWEVLMEPPVEVVDFV